MGNTILRILFEGAGGKDISMSFACADTAASDAQVQSLAEMIIANGDVYSEKPLSAVGAEFVSRTVKKVAFV